MPSITQENYLKSVYMLSQETPGAVVSMGGLARRLGVVPGTATTMAKALEKKGWVRYQPRRGVQMTASGETVALQILRKHRIVEMFLVQVLKLDWTEVHREAEALEHALSDKLVARMDEFLDRPHEDPHGDPIPDESGAIRAQDLVSLAACESGTIARVARIREQDEEFLRYLDRSGLAPGADLVVLSHEPISQMLQFRLDGQEEVRHLSTSAAMEIMVRVM